MLTGFTSLSRSPDPQLAFLVQLIANAADEVAPSGGIEDDDENEKEKNFV